MLSGARIERLAREFDRELRRLENTAIARLDAALYRAAQRLEAELRRYYMRTLEEAALSPNLLLREARARLLLEQVRAALNITAGAQANAAFTELIGGAFDLGERDALKWLSEYGEQLVGLSSNARLNVAARATATADRLAHHGAALAMKTEELVIDGIVRGRGFGATARELRRETNLTRWKAQQLVITESVTASDDARRAGFAEHGVEYVQRIGVLDNRICPYCAARVGRVYRLDDAPAALHPNDRCINAPYRPEWREAGLVDDDWTTQNRREIMENLEERGLKPNYGVAPFERANGLEKPPEYVWSP